MKLSIVIPVFNEERTLATLVARVDTAGTGRISETALAKLVRDNFELTPRGIPVDFRPDWESLHADWAGTDKKEVSKNPKIRPYKEFHATLGLKDTPVSVEEIIQRFLIGPNLTRVPQINPPVDAVNVVAVQTLIPLGVFDADCVDGSIVLDRASERET
jgi:hypothetical protein